MKNTMKRRRDDNKQEQPATDPKKRKAAPKSLVSPTKCINVKPLRIQMAGGNVKYKIRQISSEIREYRFYPPLFSGVCQNLQDEAEVARAECARFVQLYEREYRPSFGENGYGHPINLIVYQVNEKHKEAYQEARTTMKEANEILAFHGTTSARARRIMLTNFDPKFMGKNGLNMGRGFYFSTSAYYALNYAQHNGGLVGCRLLTGSASKDMYHSDPCQDDIPHDSHRCGDKILICQKDQVMPVVRLFLSPKRQVVFRSQDVVPVEVRPK